MRVDFAYDYETDDANEARWRADHDVIDRDAYGIPMTIARPAKPPRRDPVPIIAAADATRLGAALEFAAAKHGRQARTGTTVPYVSHLLHVAGFVLEHGGSIDEAIAALLHDVVEDCDVSHATVRRRFGGTVAALVDGCTDTLAGDTSARKSSWRARKEHYLTRLAHDTHGHVLVSACDKRHNLKAIVDDVRRIGPSYMDRFSAGSDEQIWFYTAFRTAIAGRVPPALEAELAALLADLRRLLT